MKKKHWSLYKQPSLTFKEIERLNAHSMKTTDCAAIGDGFIRFFKHFHSRSKDDWWWDTLGIYVSEVGPEGKNGFPTWIKVELWQQENPDALRPYSSAKKLRTIKFTPEFY